MLWSTLLDCTFPRASDGVVDDVMVYSTGLYHPIDDVMEYSTLMFIPWGSNGVVDDNMGHSSGLYHCFRVGMV